jgi:flagellar biogenesis protein FliO
MIIALRTLVEVSKSTHFETERCSVQSEILHLLISLLLMLCLLLLLLLLLMLMLG